MPATCLPNEPGKSVNLRPALRPEGDSIVVRLMLRRLDKAEELNRPLPGGPENAPFTVTRISRETELRQAAVIKFFCRRQNPDSQIDMIEKSCGHIVKSALLSCIGR